MAFMSALPERMLSSASLAASHLGFNVLAPLAKPVGIETLARMLQKMATPGVGTRPPAAPVSTTVSKPCAGPSIRGEFSLGSSRSGR